MKFSTRLKLLLSIGFMAGNLLFVEARDTTLVRPPAVFSLQQALNDSLLRVKISGVYDFRSYQELLDGDGMYYGKCIEVQLLSRIDSMVLIKLDCGRLLVPDDSSVQTMIITHDVLAPLYPRSRYATRIYAMCTQYHDAAPQNTVNFTYGPMGQAQLVKLARHIQNSHSQDIVGQDAMWAVTDHVNEGDLIKYGADSTSLVLTRKLLTEIGVETAINPIKSRPGIVEQPADTGLITIPVVYIYGGVIALVLLGVGTWRWRVFQSAKMPGGK